MDTSEVEETEKAAETQAVYSDQEAGGNETSQTHLNDQTKLETEENKPQALSPKVSRPKLPDFKENGQIRSPSHHGRAKTDPGQGSEIKAIIDKTVEDIKELNQVEFTKIYSRPKKFPKPFPHKSQSTHASPRASPTPGSPCIEESGPSSLNRNRSRSLKILTDILKSGRGGVDYRLGNITKAGKDDGTAKSISDSQLVPRKPSLVKEEDSERRSSSDGQLQTKGNSDKSQVSNSSSTQDSGTGDSSHDKTSTSTPEVPSPVDEKDPHSPSKKRTFTKFRRAKSEAPKISALSDDEGLGITESDQENPSQSSQKPYHTIDTNSQFFKIWKTGTPKRRSGFSSLVHSMYRSGPHSYADDSLKTDDQSHGCRKLHRVELKPIPTGRKASQPRHATHPPNSKKTFREEGAMDSNGFGTVLKSPSTESPPPFPGPFEQKTSDLSLTDSQFSQSDYGDESIFPNVDGLQMQDSVASVDKPPERKNGKTTKQKSRSDPSGNKSKDKENVNLPHIVSSSHSSPILSKSSEDEGDTEGTLKTEDTEEDDSLDKSSLARSPSNSFDEGQPLNFEVSGSNRSSLTPDVTDDDQGSVGTDVPRSTVRYTTVIYPEISGTSSPSSQSSTSERNQNLLEVPGPQSKKSQIGRSASSASVLQRKVTGHMKEETRKHSLTTGEGSGSESKQELVPLADTTIQSTSMPSLNKNGQRKDKRYHIVEELYRNEQEYVEALTVLKDKYMLPLKTSCSSVDENLVDNIFYMIPEILMHHTVYRNALDKVWSNWDTKKSTIGNLIIATFSKQTVIDCYLSFVENYKTSGKVIENALQTKSSVQKFIEQCHKESGSKLTMKDLIVRPIQRIPRYELLLQRLIEHTTREHPDFLLLKDAEKVMHDFAIKLGTVNESQHEEDQQESLKRLELLLLTDLAAPDRQYLRHDMVQILTKKDQCCLWLFSDLILFSSLKRRTGPVPRKVSIILKSPTGQDFAENIKHKVWLKVGLDAVEIVKSQSTLARRNTVDPDQLERDISILNDVNDLSNKLSCSHSSLDDILKEMLSTLNKQLSDIMVQSPSIDSNKLDILVTTQEGIYPLEIVFNSGEKRGIWESTFFDAKQKLSLMSDKRAPEFLQPLQITKTRAGMQFSCAAPIDGLNASGFRDVWVCNSDGYVGHMCLLSLQPEPIVTLNTPVPGCNARILCICAVPAYSGTFRRKSSGKKVKHPVIPSVKEDARKEPVEEVDDNTEEEDGFPGEEDGYQTDSESSDDDEEEDEEENRFREKQEDRVVDVLDIEVKRTPISEFTRSSPDPITLSGNWTRDPHKSTMWLGTEDGCIHIFQCTDNIKTTKNKLKIHHESPVYCIVYLDNKVFVSLANGDLIVYRRDVEGIWDSENPYTRTIGTAQSPITRMLAVAGRLWCGCQNIMKVINPLTLTIETSFHATSDSNRCVQCLVCSGQGVWLATQQSSKVLLYHATTYDLLLEVNIAQAVAQKLQSADDIIRQHKAACLRITALLVCKDLLWVGTSAGVILTIPMPRITSTTTKGSISSPSVTGLIYGHTGHVRFLTCVEMTSTASTSPKSEGDEEEIETENLAIPDIHRRSSVAATTATMATRMLVISGGDGYEDFRNNVANESAGRDDSTNHLLLWQV